MADPHPARFNFWISEYFETPPPAQNVLVSRHFQKKTQASIWQNHHKDSISCCPLTQWFEMLALSMFFSSHLTISFAPFQLSHKLDSSGWTRHSHGMVRGPGCNAHLTLESRFLPGENGRLLEFFFPMGREEAKSPSKKHEERRLEADCDPDYRTKTYGGQGGNGRFKGKNGGWFFQVYFGSDFF